MKKYLPLISGSLFFFIACLILFMNRAPLLYPAVEVDIHRDADLGPVYKDYLFIQEFTAGADYLNGVEIVLGNLEPQNTNENVLLICDSKFNILERFRIPGKEVGQVKHYPFYLSSAARVGKGNPVYICLYSVDGAAQNNIALARKVKANIGKIFVAHIDQGDVMNTLRSMKGNVFEGSFAMKIYESDSTLFYGARGYIFLLILAITLIIIFFRQLKKYLERWLKRPEWIFAGIGLTAGLAMVFVTPPLQVPDEIVHFYGSYRVSELNLFDFDYDIPASLKEFSEPFERLKFRPVEKLFMEEINSHADTPLDPGRRITEYTGNYAFPYAFPALGIMVGRIFDLSPLNLMYAGRIANLILSLLLLFLAIRTTPVLKWLFLLLGLMPMMVNQMASLSYDGITYGMTFLFLGMVFNLAFGEERRAGRKELLLLFLVALVLGLCKPPYMLVVLTILIVPVRRIGSGLRFGLVAAGLVATVALASQHMAVRPWFVTERPAVALADTSMSPADTTAAADTLPDISPNPINKLNPTLQKQFLMENPGKYPGIVYNTMTLAWDVYTACFVGLLGWVDTPLPGWLTYTYLMLLLITALVIAERAVRIGLLTKLWLFGLFLLTFLMVMTGMYIYANVPGSPIIHAVQGRYFIPLAPLFFIIFYNYTIGRRLDEWSVSRPKPTKTVSSGKNRPNKPAASATPLPKADPTGSPAHFSLYYRTFLVIAVIVSLAVTFYTILSRYYIITG